jgi:L-histidine N-alpha-methyltransferase
MHQVPQPQVRRGDAVRRTRRADQALDTMIAEVRQGLGRRPLPELPCKYFYDERGCALFEEITRLPEYYPARTETGILAEHADGIVEAVAPVEIVELGSGACRKIRFFLDAVRYRGWLESIQLLEFSETALADSVARLQHDYPEARVRGVVGDFADDLEALGPGGGRLVLFLAGTIGNLDPEGLPAFFRKVAAVLEPEDAFLVGVDLVKDEARLHAAYNDSQGVTAEFNRNILRVLNARLGADFDPWDFDHRAFYDPERQWIEMRLRARRSLEAHIPRAGTTLALQAGDEIRTELSCKYTRETFAARLRGSGLELERWMTDPQGLFASVLLRRR